MGEEAKRPDVAEDQILEMLEQLRKEEKESKAPTRAAHEPSSTEKRRRGRPRKKVVIEEEIPEVKVAPAKVETPKEVGNPRTANSTAARNQRIREMKWRLRQKVTGVNPRRAIYDAKGEDTGATTSNLG